MKLHRRLLRLLDRLISARHRQADVLDDFSQPRLVLGRMEAAIERGFFDLTAEAILQLACLLDDHVLILGVARHDVMMNDEAGRTWAG